MKSQKGVTVFSENTEAIKLQLSVISMHIDVLNSGRLPRTCLTLYTVLPHDVGK